MIGSSGSSWVGAATWRTDGRRQAFNAGSGGDSSAERRRTHRIQITHARDRSREERRACVRREDADGVGKCERVHGAAGSANGAGPTRLHRQPEDRGRTSVHGDVHRAKKRPERREIGLEFSEPSPLFWRIAFPPEDWDPSERKRSGTHHQQGPRTPSGTTDPGVFPDITHTSASDPRTICHGSAL